jgi:hypothetical protein
MRSMVSKKGWRLDGLLTPYARVCVGIIGLIMRRPQARPVRDI